MIENKSKLKILKIILVDIDPHHTNHLFTCLFNERVGTKETWGRKKMV